MRTQLDWKVHIPVRAETLVELVTMDAPEVIIARQWALLYEAMVNHYGGDFIEKGQADLDRCRAASRDEGN